MAILDYMQKDDMMRRLATCLSWIFVIILVLLPFHAFMTVWAASAVGHYTLLRLWKEFLLVVLIVGCLVLLARDMDLLKKLLSLWVTRIILIYSLLLLIWGLIPLMRHDVSTKAMFYGLLVDLRFLIFFLVSLVIAAKSSIVAANWKKVLLAPALLVAGFAVAQYLLLPYDFLKHFGYGAATISPYETINHDIHHIRVESTLRGANPLGAYLILPVCALAVLLMKERERRSIRLLLAMLMLLALLFSFSRSAWLGVSLSLLTLGWLYLRSARAKKIAAWSVASVIIVAAVLAVSLRNNLSFQDAIFHTNRVSKIASSSNQGHAAAFKAAVRDIARHPFGSGVGTAGPQSVYNKNGARIAENYFLQIGQEAGIIAMTLFITICVIVGKMLYRNKQDSLAIILLASLIGITLVNLLSHAWTDDTLAYIWWGLAGVCLAPILTGRLKQKNAKTH